MITWDDLALSNPVAIYEKAVETNVEVTDYRAFLRHSMLDGDVRLPKVHAIEPLGIVFAQTRKFSRYTSSARKLRKVASKLNFKNGEF